MMLSSTANNVIFIILLLLFTVTNVRTQCSYSQKTCYGYPSWCCSYDETCGGSYGSCEDGSTLPPTVIAIIIVTSIFCFVTCLSCCIRSHQQQNQQQHQQQHQQQLRAAYANSNMRVNRNPYQQQVIRGPVRVVHVRPVSHVGVAPLPHTFPSMYEAPPPSYESVTATLPPVHQLSLQPPITATVEHSN